MSAFEALFNKAFFKAPKCKTLLKLTIPRIKLLRNRREMQLKQMRKEIAKLLETGQEATARIRVEHIIREENIMAAQEILELFCELVTVRLPIIESQRECPLDLKEAISSICFAAPRCADLPELQQVQMLFAAKYGKEFVAAASELLPDCGVNRQIIELLSIRAPIVEVKMKLLKEIAVEHDVDWDPSATESKFFKLHEDLLNGPSAFIGGSTLPLPNEKYSESLPSPAKPAHGEQEDEDDTDLESLDLPEVPKASVHPSDISSTVPLPEIFPSVPTMPPSDSAFAHGSIKSTLDSVPHNDVCLHTPPSFTVDVKEQPKQFVPFVSPLLPSAIPSLGRPHEAAPSFSIPSPSPTPLPIPPLTQVKTEIEPNDDLEDVVAEIAGPTFSLPSQSPIPIPIPPLPQVKTKIEASDDDLKDVLAAAQAAAETAERAAAAARAVASLAQVRITEFAIKKNGKLLEMCGGEAFMNGSSQAGFAEKREIDEHHLPENCIPPAPLHELPKSESESHFPSSYQSNHQPSRSPSLEDDPYFTYPNLFSRHNSDLKSATDNSP